MALTYISDDVIGNAPGGGEGCFGTPVGPPSDYFKRQISDASTTAPDTPIHCSTSPKSVMTSFLPMGNMSPMMHYDLPDCGFAETSSAPSSNTWKELEEVSLVMADVTPFQMPATSAPLRLPPAEDAFGAEEKAVEAVKAKLGEDVNEEEEVVRHAEDRTEQVEKDGITWVVARGRPPTTSRLEGKLAEVKSLYKAKFGEDVDDEEDGDDEEKEVPKHADGDTTDCVKKDGITWVVTRGRPPTTPQLEEKLAEVKSLYKAKFGEDVDGEEDEDELESNADGHKTDRVKKDGITWVVARGRPPTTPQLEEKLAEVKSLYKAKFGEDVDEEDEVGTHVDEDKSESFKKDGIAWLVTRGRPPTLSQLEDRLAEVKSLYKAKFGEDVDEEDEEEEVGSDADEQRTARVEKDGITWVIARGHPPTMSQLEDRLAEVKFLYKAKFGEDVDEEEEEDVGKHADEDRTEQVEKDGITWVVARGRPPTMSQLEDKLAEVKRMYTAKYGGSVDDDDEDGV